MRTTRSMPLVLFAALLAVGGSPAQATDHTETSFSTPEDAIREYLEGVAGADVQRILSATAHDEIADGFRFDLYIERVGGLSPNVPWAPAEYPFFADIASAMQSSDILSQVRTFVYNLLSDEEIDSRLTIRRDKAWAEDFVRQIDPSRLRSLVIVDIGFPEAAVVELERYREIVASRSRVYAADDMTERAVLFSFDGQLYVLGFTLIRYGDDWKIFEQQSALANPASGGGRQSIAQLISLQQWERLTGGRKPPDCVRGLCARGIFSQHG